MQHLDDALIAEWVDGAIAEGSPQHAAIAAHVAQCDECRVRADEERALAGHVRELLAVAAPPDPIPAFDEVLHRAGRRRPAGIATVWRRLAWAATIVVAGGVGWYGRGLLQRTEQTQQTSMAVPAGDVTDGSPSPASEPLALNQVEAPRAEAAAAPARPSEEARADADEGARPTIPAAPPPVAGAIAGRQEHENTAGAAMESAATRGAARRDATPPVAAEAVGGLAPPAAAQPSVQEATGQPLRMQKIATASWTPVPRAVAERVLGGPLRTVPDLAVRGVEVAPDGATVRVLQDLGDGVTLELIETAATDDAPQAVTQLLGREGERAAEGGPVEAAVLLAGVRVTGRAAVTRDSLAALLARLR